MTRRPDEGYQIRIDRDGTWYYHGSPIRRMELVKLFSTVLRRDEAGDYWLVTPAERGRIQVDEVPFTAVGLTVRGEGDTQELIFRTNLDVEVTAGPIIRSGLKRVMERVNPGPISLYAIIWKPASPGRSSTNWWNGRSRSETGRKFRSEYGACAHSFLWGVR